jgi:hypothetical protein
MLRKPEKKALASLFLLCIGAPIALDKFYEDGIGAGLLGISLNIVAIISIAGIIVWLFLVFRKMFKLLDAFINASD